METLLLGILLVSAPFLIILLVINSIYGQEILKFIPAYGHKGEPGYIEITKAFWWNRRWISLKEYNNDWLPVSIENWEKELSEENAENTTI